MNREEVVTLACNYAEREGYVVGRYDISLEREGSEWHVNFHGKPKARPGDFFTVLIDDVAQKVKALIAGI
jgi:hypothetical protein